ncbi:hypothetical protein BH11PLA1_BH11PLA1_13120 [soil metagenome]
MGAGAPDAATAESVRLGAANHPETDAATLAADQLSADRLSADRLSAENAAITAGSATYGADQIQVLEGLEAVRKRPGMYIGGTGIGPLHHLIYEVVDNSIDEAMAGFASTVWVTIATDGSCSVVDDGRGIPVECKTDPNPAYDGKPAVEIAMTVLHAGGKFGAEGSAYKVSGGLHGVGVSCVNALSEWLEAEIYRAGNIHVIEFERGRTVKPLRIVGPIPADSPFKTGTKVTFAPDPQIFADTTFDFPTLQNRLRELSFLNPGVTIKLTDERVGPDGLPRSETFRARDGLREYVQHLMHGRAAVSDLIAVRKEDKAGSLLCEVAMQYHDGYSELLLTFANNINNKDGGTHATGFKNALTRVLNAYAKKTNILKDSDPAPSGEDLREGLIAVISIKLPNPTFNNQPKERLLNPEVEKFVADAVSEQLMAWLEEHPGEAKRICLKGIVAAQAREAARKARELTRRKSALEGGSMPHKLKDCKSREVDQCEIFIVEGDSAGGSAGQGRNVDNQAILPLKGKIINVEKARLDKVLGFEEVRTLISALRCGIGEEFDAAKLRYGRIIIMTDADVDGSHIRTLLLTFFFRQMPELIRRGKIFCAQPPLYLLEWSKQKGQKAKSEYVVNAGAMESVLSARGLARAALVVRDITNVDPRTREPAVTMRVQGEEARRLIRTLQRLRELVEIAERRGVRFAELLAARALDPSGLGGLPTHRLAWTGGEAFAWSEEHARQIAATRNLILSDMIAAALAVETPALPDAAAAPHTNGTAAAHSNGVAPHPAREPKAPASVTPPKFIEGKPVATLRELHENRELARVFDAITGAGLDIADYALTRAAGDSGHLLPTKFVWELTESERAEPEPASAAEINGTGVPPAGEDLSDAAGATQIGADIAADDTAEAANTSAALKASSRVVEVESLAGILEGLHQIGRRGLSTIKRFKGLGEMNAEQLWETTMDPSKRTLLRIDLDNAAQADQLFSVLMGEEVEPRRRFIEEHALEVKNLDV